MVARGGGASAASASSAHGSKLDHGPSGSPIAGDTTPAPGPAAIRVRTDGGYGEAVLGRRLAATLVATVCMVTAPVGDAVVLADGDLDESSTSTYTIDPIGGVVRVSVEMTVTNLAPDRTEGNTIYSRYYTGYLIPASAATANATAVDSAGRALTVTATSRPELPGYVLYNVEFAGRLYYRQTERFTLTYDIVGLPPRSPDPTRINPAYFGFSAFGTGDSGAVTVRIVAPDGVEVDLLGDPVTIERVAGATIYSAEAIADPDEHTVIVSARNDGALDRTSLTVGGGLFEVLSWPGDSTWQTFVRDQVETGVPVLIELLGQPWPIDDTLELVQATTPYLYGYAGWFSARERLIEVGEDLDQEVVLHELSHAWFNDQWFTDRWVNEGLAQVYSNKAVAALGGAPLAPDPIERSDPGFIELNDWDDLSLDGDNDAREGYGYNASFAVMDQLVDEVGEEAMREVLDAVADGTIAYRGELPPEVTAGTTNWRRFLDLVDELGGSTAARDLFEQYVIADEPAGLLDARDAAREQYGELLADGGTWAGPVVVRRHLSDWSFAKAEAAIVDATEVLARRDTMIDKATALGISHPTGFEAAYEAVDDSFDEVESALDEQIETFDTVSSAIEADARDDGFFESIGLWGTDVPAMLDEARSAAATGDHDAARAAASEAVDTIDRSADVGTTRFALAVGAVVGLVLLVTLLVLAVRRRRRRHRRAKAPVEAPVEEPQHPQPDLTDASPD